jgi:uncharacterized membrane protein YagU involved in acid resistance
MSKAGRAIFWGGLGCGILDILSATVSWYIRAGIAPARVFKSVAGGLIGRQVAQQGGAGIAALGLGLHFLIAFIWAAVYYMASRKIAFLRTHAIISGLIYGEIVFLFMNVVVLPLSALHTDPLQWTSFSPWPVLIAGPLGHPFFVGLPIALATKRFGPGNRS